MTHSRSTTLLLTAIMLLSMLPAGAADRREALRDSILSLVTGASSPKGKQVSITSFGARPDGTTDCRRAFDKAMRQAERRGSLRLTVPAGTYFIKGPLTLVSNVEIELQEGATLRFSPDPTCYPIVNTSWEGTFLWNYSPMIYGHGLHNVIIKGRGTIDGNAMTTFATWKKNQRPAQQRSRQMNHDGIPVAERRFGEGDYLRPHLMQLYNCSGITLEGVKIINSPFWCIHLLCSDNIILRGLRYDAKLINNDGIDPECSRNILIEDIDFDNGDDNIAIKSGRDDDGRNMGRPSENIVIRNCRFKGLHGVVIGSEMSAGVRNIIIENCTAGGYCKRGIYVKTNPDRGGFVTGLWVNNCAFGDVEDLFYVTSCYAGEGMDNVHFSTIADIHVDGLTCRRAKAAALVLQGTKSKPITDVTFTNVAVDSAQIGISFSDTRNVTLNDCFIGGRVTIPSQAH